MRRCASLALFYPRTFNCAIIFLHASTQKRRYGPIIQIPFGAAPRAAYFCIPEYIFCRTLTLKRAAGQKVSFRICDLAGSKRSRSRSEISTLQQRCKTVLSVCFFLVYNGTFGFVVPAQFIQ